MHSECICKLFELVTKDAHICSRVECKVAVSTAYSDGFSHISPLFIIYY